MTVPVVACVVNHEGEDKLAACLDALRGQGGCVSGIVVVDDASTDGSLALIGERCPEARVVALPRTLGPAVARNAGFRAIDASRVLFVDNDVVLTRGCVSRLSAALDEDVGAVLAMPRIVRAADPGTIDFEGATGHWLGQLVPGHAGEPRDVPERPTREAGSLISSCFLMDRTRWGDVPPFDEAFRFNYEDHELGLRCRVAGHRLLVVPSAECLHGSGTVGASVRGSGAYPPLRVRSLVQGRWQILITLYQLRTLFLLAPALVLFEVVQLAGAARRGWLGSWVGAVAGVATGLPGLLAKRRRVQRGRSLPDRAVLADGPLPFRTELARGRAERAVLGLLDRAVAGHLRIVRRLL